MITALNKGGDRGSALVRVSAVAFEETSSSDGAFSAEFATNGVYGHQIFEEMSSHVFCLRLASSWPVFCCMTAALGLLPISRRVACNAFREAVEA